MGHDVGQDPMAVKQVIGISPQETAVAENLSARENLMLIGRIRGRGKEYVRETSDRLLEMVGLSERARRAGEALLRRNEAAAKHLALGVFAFRRRMTT